MILNVENMLGMGRALVLESAKRVQLGANICATVRHQILVSTSLMTRSGAKLTHRAREQAHLIQADRHIAKSKERIRKQELLIERLTAHGLNTANAEDFLLTLTNTLKAFERHRGMILDALAT